eukprot:1315500-Amorphochlora_amoeboformis.AAC.1
MSISNLESRISNLTSRISYLESQLSNLVMCCGSDLLAMHLSVEIHLPPVMRPAASIHPALEMCLGVEIHVAVSES